MPRLVLVFGFGLATSVILCGDEMTKELISRGYRMYPRASTIYGAASVVKLKGKNIERFSGTSSQCFVDIANVDDKTVLFDSKTDSNLKIGATASFAPAEVAKIAGEFGYDRASSVEIEFKNVRVPGINDMAFADALAGKAIKAGCLAMLKKKDYAVVLEAVKVGELSYSYTGNRKTKFSIDAVKALLKAAGLVKYEVAQEKTFKILEPMYIAGSVVKFEDLGLPVPNSSDKTLPVRLEKGRFKLSRIE